MPPQGDELKVPTVANTPPKLVKSRRAKGNVCSNEYPSFGRFYGFQKENLQAWQNFILPVGQLAVLLAHGS